jgi:hypothetical protein
MKEFNSQVCTTKEQSQRLLNLGLKPETADMKHLFDDRNDYSFFHHWVCLPYKWDKESLVDRENIPAWSLHRLIELLPQDIHLDDYADTHYYLTINPFKVIYANSHRLWIYQRNGGCLYDKLIDTIEWTIKNNFFNKEYLKQ